MKSAKRKGISFLAFWAAAALCAAAAAVLFFFAPGIAQKLLREELEYLFGAPVAVGHVSLNPFTGRLSAHDVAVSQPPGYGTHPALKADSVEMRFSYLPLLKRRIEIAYAVAAGVSLEIIEKPDGSVNVLKWFEPSENAEAGADAGAAEWAFALDHLEARGTTVNYAWAGEGGDVRTIRLERARVLVSNLEWTDDFRADMTVDARFCAPPRLETGFKADIAFSEPENGDFNIAGKVVLSGIMPDHLGMSGAERIGRLFGATAFDVRFSGEFASGVAAGALSLNGAGGAGLASIDKTAADFSAGQYDFSGIRLNQPPGFGDSALLSIPGLRISIGAAGEQGAFVIDEIALNNPQVTLVRGRDGVLNIERIISSFSDSSKNFVSDAHARDSVPANKPDQDSRPARPPAEAAGFVVRRADIWNMSLRYAPGPVGDAAADEIVTATASATNLSFNTPAGQSGVAVKGTLRQTPFNDGTFKAELRSGPFGGEAISIEGSLWASGIGSDRIAEFLPGHPVEFWGGAGLELAMRSAFDGNVVEAGFDVDDDTSRTVVGCDKLRYDMAAGELEIREFAVAQPQKFGPGVMLLVPQARLRLDFDSGPGVFSVLGAEARGVKLVAAIDSNNVSNLESLWTKSAGASGNAPGAAGAAPDSAVGSVLLVDDVSVKDAAIEFSDQTMPRGKLRVYTKGLEAAADSLQFGGGESRFKSPGSIMLTGNIRQGTKADAFLGLYMRSGPFAGGVPAMNAVIRLGGLELETVAQALPRGAQELIGGDAVDFSVDLSFYPDLLDCLLVARPVGGGSLPLRISGPPGKLNFDRSSALFLVFGGLIGRVGGVFNRAGDTGRAAFQTVYGATMDLGRGAGRIIETAGGGVVAAAKGIASADAKGAASGLVQATWGTVAKTVGTLWDTGRNVIGGAGRIHSATTGGRHGEEWRADAYKRWSRDWQEAVEKTLLAPFPPGR